MYVTVLKVAGVVYFVLLVLFIAVYVMLLVVFGFLYLVVLIVFGVGDGSIRSKSNVYILLSYYAMHFMDRKAGRSEYITRFYYCSVNVIIWFSIE